jgi:hypothetical protein
MNSEEESFDFVPEPLKKELLESIHKHSFHCKNDDDLCKDEQKMDEIVNIISTIDDITKRLNSYKESKNFTKNFTNVIEKNNETKKCLVDLYNSIIGGDNDNNCIFLDQMHDALKNDNFDKDNYTSTNVFDYLNTRAYTANTKKLYTLCMHHLSKNPKDSYAMNNLGFLYKNDVVYTHAKVWYKKAADLGNVYAKSNLNFFTKNNL